MMDKRNLLKLMVLALGVSVLLFVFGYPRGVQPIDEHTIRYVIEQEPSTLDPAKSTTSPEATVQLQLFDGLVRLNDESEPEAALAKNWDISDDGREYTFHLRPNLKWSNGEPLTAYDFEYAWKRVLDPEVHADNAYMLYVLENGEAFNTGKAAAEDVGVKAIDEDTLVVTLENPTAYFLKLLASHSYYPVSKKAVEAHENWAANAETIVSNGPYRLLSWKHNGEMDFIKNGSVSVFTLIASFFFMSISFPTIFALSITDIPDALVKTASSVLIMTIVGGAIMPYFMGLVADHHNIETSFLLLIPCFLFVAWYGFFGSCPKVMK